MRYSLGVSITEAPEQAFLGWNRRTLKSRIRRRRAAVDMVFC